MNSNAIVEYYLGQKCTRLTADLGIDDSDVGKGSVTYDVWLDGTKVYDSGLVTNTTPTVPLDVDVAGAQMLRLVVTDGGDGYSYDNADIAGAKLACL